MKLKTILESIDAKTVLISEENILDSEYEYVGATDLMSDALALVESDSEKTFLLTGLVNAQSFRTAEMLDVTTILFVRNKFPQDHDLELAKEMKLNLFSTPFSMYEACGKLYAINVKTATKKG